MLGTKWQAADDMSHDVGLSHSNIYAPITTGIGWPACLQARPHMQAPDTHVQPLHGGGVSKGLPSPARARAREVQVDRHEVALVHLQRVVAHLARARTKSLPAPMTRGQLM